jgi:hypothetical protein
MTGILVFNVGLVLCIYNYGEAVKDLRSYFRVHLSRDSVNFSGLPKTKDATM